MHVIAEGCGWDLWKCLEQTRTSVGFWFQLWKGAESQYSLIEKQLAAVYVVLQSTEAMSDWHGQSVGVHHLPYTRLTTHMDTGNPNRGDPNPYPV